MNVLQFGPGGDAGEYKNTGSYLIGIYKRFNLVPAVMPGNTPSEPRCGGGPSRLLQFGPGGDAGEYHGNVLRGLESDVFASIWPRR